MELLYKEIKERKDLRAMSLLATYFLIGNSEKDHPILDSHDIVETLEKDFNHKVEWSYVKNAIKYLEHEYLVEWKGNTGNFNLTHRGLKTVEEFIEKLYLIGESDIDLKTDLEREFGDITLEDKISSRKEFSSIKNNVISNLISHIIVKSPSLYEDFSNL